MKIRIEQISSVDFKYPYLEVFENDENNPFLDIGITDNKEVELKFYASDRDIILTIDDWEQILLVTQQFVPKAIANDESFSKWYNVYKKDVD